MSESIAEVLSVFGLVVGFPLLLLALMISLERLETWGLRPPDDVLPDPDTQMVEAAVEAVEQRTAPVPQEPAPEPSPAPPNEAVGATAPRPRADGH